MRSSLALRSLANSNFYLALVGKMAADLAAGRITRLLLPPDLFVVNDVVLSPASSISFEFVDSIEMND
jgi:hypothetical protein